MNEQILSKELLAVAQGNRKALKNIFNIESDNLYTFALQVLGKEELAQEAVINAFIAIWKNASFYNEKLNSRGWIYTIFRFGLNQIAKSHLNSLHPSPTVVHNLQREVEQFKSDGSFYRVFEELPLHTQTSFLTLYFSPHHVKDIANALSMSEEELRNSIKMGVKHLSSNLSGLNTAHTLNSKIGELILGTLSEEEEHELNGKIAIDPEADLFTYQWENLYLEFLKQIPLKRVPKNLWLKIQKAILKLDSGESEAIKELDESINLEDKVVDSKTSSFSKPIYLIKKCWISRTFWRLTSLLLTAFIIWILVSNPFTNQPKFVSILNQSSSNQLAYLIKVNNSLEIIPAISQNVDSKSDLKLWHLNASGYLTPLGIINPNSTTKIKNNLSITSGDSFIISLEPKSAVTSVAETLNTSPDLNHSQVPGPTLYSGKIAKW
ncbi:sigma factor [Taylorella equigenitalis]|uniref:RNA polymerase sigma factor n=2 Tax=Taylorella equigenitalis TaxID=29575 RepID=A0A654KJ51_TAYEM|nr:sigma factor [Taylorella equigenitalis]ADU92364.1 hypothetical protein TEQUI_1450 [Taylorella equigenitalis MCE9]AFN35918.1 putative Sigma Factor [Taylorella equigenitalis ATCC 35865]ASY37859.1 RNA polymerase subunit sigma [Taylorella equigenitalis]ASY39327.1 RNA polymerase subunit sigma [Taylorella equigenitalis]ASY40845.1 RNA polymerase subunit sigma [Taylorella equigenitalis]